MRRALVVVVGAVLVVLLTASGASAQYKQCQPGFVLSPSQVVTPGAVINAVGFGCGCGTAQPVTITINGEVVATTTSGGDAEGNFSITFTGPTGSGTYVVVAKCADTIQSNILTVSIPVTASGGLPATGSDATVPLTRLALALVMAGGLIVLVTRRRRDEAKV